MRMMVSSSSRNQHGRPLPPPSAIRSNPFRVQLFTVLRVTPKNSATPRVEYSPSPRWSGVSCPYGVAWGRSTPRRRRTRATASRSQGLPWPVVNPARFSRSAICSSCRPVETSRRMRSSAVRSARFPRPCLGRWTRNSSTTPDSHNIWTRVLREGTSRGVRDTSRMRIRSRFFRCCWVVVGDRQTRGRSRESSRI